MRARDYRAGMSEKTPRKSTPAPPGCTRKTVALRDATWERVDAYRHDNRIRSEREAVQRVVDAGLDGAAEIARLRALLATANVDPDKPEGGTT